MNRIKGFDGLRAVAVLAVFAFHRTPLWNSNLGHAGVLLFFALSGWLVCGILHDLRLRAEAGALSIGHAGADFFRRRVLRIFPVYYATLAMAGLFVVAGLPPKGWSWGAYLFDLAFLSNVWFAAHDWTYWGGHFWSLAIEVWFYFLAGPLLLITRSRIHLRLLAGLALLGLLQHSALLISGASLNAAYTDFVTNFGFLAMGGVANLASRSIHASPPPLVAPALLMAALALALVPGHSALYEAAFYATPLLAAGLVFALAHRQDGPLVKVLELAPLRRLGEMSYGFYLFHAAFDIHWGRERLAAHHGYWLDVAANLAATVALAAASYWLFERPVMRLGSARAIGRASGLPRPINR